MSMDEALRFIIDGDLKPLQDKLRRVPQVARPAGAAMARAFTSGAAALGAVASTAGAATIAISKAAIQTGAEFEMLEARLATLLGSSSAARERMVELQKQAATTPFEISQLVEATAALEGFGANSREVLPAVMDLSGAMGLDLVESATAVGRAFAGGAGAADVLRDRGVLAMVEMRTGMKATEMEAHEFQKALIETLTDPNGKIAGGTARLAGTFSGMVSNLKDEWTGFTKEVADAGLFDASKAGLRETLDLLQENKGEIKDIAQGISDTAVPALAVMVQGFAAVAKWPLQVQYGVVAMQNQITSAMGTVLEFGDKALQVGAAIHDGMGDPFGILDDIGENVNRIRTLRAGVGSLTSTLNEEATDLAGRIQGIEDAAEGAVDAMLRAAAGAGQLRDAASGGAPTGKNAPGVGQDDIDEARDELNSLRRQVFEDHATKLDLINLKYADRRKELDEIEAVLGRTAATEAAAHEMRVSHETEIQELLQETRDERREAMKEAAELEQAAHDKRMANAANYQSASASLAGSLATMFRQSSEAQTDADRAEAEKRFRIYKALSIAEAGLNAAAGVTRAFRDHPFPLSLLMAGATSLAAAGKVQAVKSMEMPAFDVGGTVRAGGLVGSRTPDQVPIRALPDEGIVSTTGMRRLGERGLNRLNRGESADGGIIVMRPDRHRNRYLADSVRSDGRLRRELLSRPVGRKVTNSGY